MPILTVPLTGAVFFGGRSMTVTVGLGARVGEGGETYRRAMTPEFCNDSDSYIGCVFISCRTSMPAMGLGASATPDNLTHNFNMMG